VTGSKAKRQIQRFLKLRHNLWRDFSSMNTMFLKAAFSGNAITPQPVAQIENQIAQQAVA
jgi:hypothetical protein